MCIRFIKRKEGERVFEEVIEILKFVTPIRMLIPEKGK
jgi:hypothetical protein